ncbi:hypothetical protein [Roseivirga seohaensis]|uniref:hypothetical protein n=1 Tax=Roseivirga seohaensis TaxID=1914963 RepID=UPI00069D2DE8|nr:hypothetical protein [Roseivirga seohaensis]
MSLTVEQIAAIKAFINKRGFNTIEVEMEALDHMASKVEALLEEKPDMNFDLAITKAHADLGVFGFATFEDAINSGYAASLRKTRNSELKSYLFGSKGLITLAIITIAFSIEKVIPTPNSEEIAAISLYSYGFILLLISVITNIKVYRKWRKKSLVIQNISMTASGGSYLIGQLIKTMIEFELINQSAIPLVFIVTFSIMTVNSLISFSIIRDAIKSSEEKYLKYA